MKLSELNFGRLIKEGEFNWLGLTAEEYEGKQHLTFLESEKYLSEFLKNRTASCLITTENIGSQIKENRGIVVVENPKKTFFELHNKLAREGFYNNINLKNKISEKAYIAKTAIIKDSNIVIEDGVIIEDNVVIYSGVTLRKGVRIGAGTIIGSRPFQFVRTEDKVISIKAIGSVIIGDNTEIQCNTVIVKGVFWETNIGKNVCIDNLVHVAHDVKIGDNSFIVAGTILGGRSKLEKNSYTGINASVKNGVTLGENSRVSMGAVVSKDVNSGETVTGNLAIEHSKFIENLRKILGE